MRKWGERLELPKRATWWVALPLFLVIMLRAESWAILLFLVSLGVAGFVALQVWARESRRLDWAEAIFLSLVSLVALVGWIGVILAEIGRFSLWAVSLLVLMVAGGGLWWLRPLRQWSFGRLGQHEIALGVLLLGCTFLYFRPHEYVLGGSDAGGYLNIGATLVRTGDFVLQDDWTAFLRQYPEVTLREQPPYWRTRYLQFVGWFLDDTEPTRIIPQFFPFHPTWIAVGIALGGLYGGLMVTPVWGVLSIAAVYFFTRHLLGRSTALLAAFLLALTPTQLYFARYPTTEPLTLLLVFTGLWVCQTLWDEPDNEFGGDWEIRGFRRDLIPPSSNPRQRINHGSNIAWGILGGMIWGAAFLTRNDLPIIALLVVGFMLLRRWQGYGSRGWAAFAWTFVLTSLYALGSAVFINWPYMWNTYGYVFVLLQQSTLVSGGMVVTGVLAGSAVFWQRRQLDRVIVWVEKFIQSRPVRWALVLLVVGLSAYAYFVRPILEPVTYTANWPSNIQVPSLNGQNWVRMGWYLTPLGLLLSTLGAARLLQRESLLRLGLFLSVGLLTTIQYVYNIFNTAYHIYTMRRYVPVVIPALMIFAAVAILAVWHFRPNRWAKAAGALLAAALAVGLVYQARFVLPLRENAGAVTQLTALSQRLQPNAILLISEPEEAIFADTFGVPLHYIFGHDVVTVRGGGEAIRPFLADLQARAAAEGRPIQLLAVDTILPEVRQTLHLQPVEMFPVTLRVLMNTFFEFPSVMQTAYYGIEIYNVAAEGITTDFLEIDIGGIDSAYIHSGFYYKEPLFSGPTMRWTTNEAMLDIPFWSDSPVTIEVQAMIYRPTAVPPAPVIVSLNGEEIGQFTPTDTWQTFIFETQSPWSSPPASLRFTAPTFNPATLQLNNDTRELGFLIDWIKIESKLGSP